ncbi:MAG: MazG nucleotide pyrophosphohydrolase domain-containing protein [Candidatus Bathyarchaeia archaeon]
MGSIRDFQRMMKNIYYERDVERGAHRAALWLFSEVGELADAIVKGDVEAFNREASDVLAWLCSLCNLFNVDLEKSAYQRYSHRCPKCEVSPCKCPKEWENLQQRGC